MCRSRWTPAGRRQAGHTFFGVTLAGAAAVVTTAGNPDCHVILRGGRSGPNYEAGQVRQALATIADAGLPRRVMVDASHGNSGKDHRRQAVAASLAEQVAGGEQGLMGVMLESFLAEGRQEPADPARLVLARASPTPAWTWTPPPACSAGLPPPPAAAAPPPPRRDRGPVRS